MEYFSVNKTFDIEINKLWKSPEYKHIEYIKRGYALQDNIKTNALLFIGINPSYSGENNNGGAQYYEIEHDGKMHQYFKKFKDIAEKVEMDWTHIDLLFVRETEQKKIDSLVDNTIENGLSFVYKQLMISKKIIEKAQPKIIVVNNTLARRFMGKQKGSGYDEWMDFDFEFDNTLGTYKITNHETLSGTPVFFTSMLTGQRALDLGSYERLIWHIKFVLKQIALIKTAQKI